MGTFKSLWSLFVDRMHLDASGMVSGASLMRD
jgi:hypothetical protein